MNIRDKVEYYTVGQLLLYEIDIHSMYLDELLYYDCCCTKQPLYYWVTVFQALGYKRLEGLLG